jgi:hypothetical protein
MVGRASSQAVVAFAFLRLSNSTIPHSTAHKTTAAKISVDLGEKIRINPLSFTSAEKLDTQNGIKNNRNVCQKSSFTLFGLAAVVLMNNANPIIKLNPHEVSQSRGEESKYRSSTTRYQIK